MHNPDQFGYHQIRLYFIHDYADVAGVLAYTALHSFQNCINCCTCAAVRGLSSSDLATLLCQVNSVVGLVAGSKFLYIH